MKAFIYSGPAGFWIFLPYDDNGNMNERWLCPDGLERGYENEAVNNAIASGNFYFKHYRRAKQLLGEKYKVSKKIESGPLINLRKFDVEKLAP